jgi:hypothetical protein
MDPPFRMCRRGSFFYLPPSLYLKKTNQQNIKGKDWHFFKVGISLLICYSGILFYILTLQRQ